MWNVGCQGDSSVDERLRVDHLPYEGVANHKRRSRAADAIIQSMVGSKSVTYHVSHENCSSILQDSTGG